MTRGKRLQPERLNEMARKGCDSLNSEYRKKIREENPKRFSRREIGSNKLTWKLRSLGKAPHLLTYGLEGLEGLRVGNSDALEVRVGAYYNYTCNAPGWNLRIALSA